MQDLQGVKITGLFLVKIRDIGGWFCSYSIKSSPVLILVGSIVLILKFQITKILQGFVHRRMGEGGEGWQREERVEKE